MSKTRWRKVDVPRAWRPDPGEELEGTYLRSELRKGRYGEYHVHLIAAGVTVQYVSGAIATELFAAVLPSTRIKIVFLGRKRSAISGNEFKCFELFVAT